MTKEILDRIEKLYGKDFSETDIPTFIRNEEDEQSLTPHELTLQEMGLEQWICPECQELAIGDERVANGMKCAKCSY